MSFRYEELDDTRFQLLCQGLLGSLFEHLESPPVRQPDGGFDAFVRDSQTGKKTVGFQIKHHRPERAPDPLPWIKRVIKGERPKIELAIKNDGLKQYTILTSARGSAHPGTGRNDKLAAYFADLGQELGIEMRVWWRNDLDVRLRNAPWELKRNFSEILTGPDLMLAYSEGLLFDSDIAQVARSARVLRAYQGFAWSDDSRVRFREGEIEGLPLDQLFIDVSWRRETTRHPGTTTTRRTKDGGQMSVEVVADGISDATVSLLSARPPRMSVILGAPGQGKSTLGQYLCQAHRVGMLGRDALDHAPHDAGRAAFNLPLRSFGRWAQGLNTFDHDPEKRDVKRRRRPRLEKYLTAVFANELSDESVTASDISHIITNYPTLFLLDGLDEVADPQTRQIVVSEIEEFCDRLDADGCDFQVVVTSRPSHGLLPEPSADRFEYFELLPLTSEQRLAYVAKWCKARNLPDERSREITRILRGRLEEPHVRELATNPMQLSILLFLINQRGESVPRRRAELYSEYMKRFLDRETSKEEALGDHRGDVESATAFLGWDLQAAAEADNGAGQATKTHLVKRLRHFLVDQGRPHEHVDSLFDTVSGRVWELVSRQTGLWEFDIQPTREYFAARHIYDMSGTGASRTPSAFIRITELLERPYWENTARFLAGMFSPPEIAELVDVIETFLENYPDQLRSRRLVRQLINDGVFDSKPKPRSRIVTAVLDPIGIRCFAADLRSEKGEPLIGAEVSTTVAELTREILAADADGALAEDAAVVMAHHAPPADNAAWLLEQAGNKPDERWLRFVVKMSLGEELADSIVAEHLDDRVRASLIAAGWCRTPKSREATTQVVYAIGSGATRVFGVPKDSLAQDLLKALSPERLSSGSHPTYRGGSSGSEATWRDPIRRLRQRELCVTTLDAFTQHAGDNGTTTPHSRVAASIVEEFGRCLLPFEIALAGLADGGLREGVNLRATSGTPDHLATDPSVFMRELRSRGQTDWWAASGGRVADSLDKIVWLLSLAVVAEPHELRANLTRMDRYLGDLQPFEISTLSASSRYFASAGYVRQIPPSVLDEAYPVSLMAWLLLVPHAGLQAQISDAQVRSVMDHAGFDPTSDLVHGLAAAIWSGVRPDHEAASLDLLKLLHPTPTDPYPVKSLTFHARDGVDPLHHPWWMADVTLRSDVPVGEPLAVVAEAQEWFDPAV